MADRATVITHLQFIHTWAASARECALQFFTAKLLEDIAQWTDDAIDLLKEQEEWLRKLQKDKDKLCLDVSEWKHKYHDRALKEQEAVKPTWQQGRAYCGSCGRRIPLKIGARFCHKCGQAVKWE